MNESFHPTPQFERDRWRSLDGPWLFGYDDQGRWRQPADVTFDREIQAPFPPESIASGIQDQGFHPVVWYQRHETRQPQDTGERLLLHFGAVDYEAMVWVNGKLVATHRGGHTPFSADITEAVGSKNSFTITVRAEDQPQDLAKPRGKQDWQAEPHGIWYPRTTGIWQTVWLEPVPATRLERLRWGAHLEQWEFSFEASITGPFTDDLSLRVKLSADDGVIAEDRYRLGGAELARRIALSDPGIDDYRNDLLWSPFHPSLIEAEVELLRGDEVIDRVHSYTAMRSVSVADGRFMLNGRAFFLRMVLDQGYWPDSLMAATEADLRRDVELIKRLGFNGARKHQKIENPRWLYWCDVMGLLVWEEMPSPYRFNPDAVQRLVAEWTEAIDRDRSHPCIVVWVPFNESWGVPDLPTNPAHREYVRALYHLTKTLDPSRPVIGNDGWENIATDILGVHDYEEDGSVLLSRYGSPEAIARVLMHVQPGGRALALTDFEFKHHPVVLSEFGGVAFSRSDETGWGYSRVRDAQAFLKKYENLLTGLHKSRPYLAGFCYTQLTDTFQEKNGLLYEDRTPKAEITELSAITRGKRSAMEVEAEPTPDPFGYSKRWSQRRKV